MSSDVRRIESVEYYSLFGDQLFNWLTAENAFRGVFDFSEPVCFCRSVVKFFEIVFDFVDRKRLVHVIFADDDGQGRIDHVFDFLACLACLVHVGIGNNQSMIFGALRAVAVCCNCLVRVVLGSGFSGCLPVFV